MNLWSILSHSYPGRYPKIG